MKQQLLSGRCFSCGPDSTTGWPQKDARNKPVEEVFYLVNEYSKERNENIVDDIIKSRKPVEMGSHLLLVTKDGREIPIEDSASPIIDKEGQVIGAVFVFRDYTEKRQKENEIKYLSYYDQLTGLYNRRYYEEELKRLDTPRNYPLALVMADVNGLKLTNDAFGHIAGDNLLKKIAGILKSECRADDILARIGGDEFVILLPRTDVLQAQRIKERIIDRIKAEKSDRNIVSAAIGYAVKQSVMESMHDIGNVAIDVCIFQKNRKLDASEWHEIMKHPEIRVSYTEYGKRIL